MLKKTRFVPLFPKDEFLTRSGMRAKSKILKVFRELNQGHLGSFYGENGSHFNLDNKALNSVGSIFSVGFYLSKKDVKKDTTDTQLMADIIYSLRKEEYQRYLDLEHSLHLDSGLEIEKRQHHAYRTELSIVSHELKSNYDSARRMIRSGSIIIVTPSGSTSTYTELIRHEVMHAVHNLVESITKIRHIKEGDIVPANVLGYPDDDKEALSVLYAAGKWRRCSELSSKSEELKKSYVKKILSSIFIGSKLNKNRFNRKSNVIYFNGFILKFILHSPGLNLYGFNNLNKTVKNIKQKHKRGVSRHIRALADNECPRNGKIREGMRKNRIKKAFRILPYLYSLDPRYSLIPTKKEHIARFIRATTHRRISESVKIAKYICDHYEGGINESLKLWKLKLRRCR